MLITSKQTAPEPIYEETGSKFKVTHFERMDDIFAANKRDRVDADGTNGFSRGRLFRQIGRLGNLDLVRATEKYPEILRGDRRQKDAAWRKILRSDPEFEHCRTVRKGI